MSTSTTIVIETTDTPLVFDDVRADFSGTAVQAPDQWTDQTTDQPGRIVVEWYDTRWQVEGLQALALRWSADFDASVEVVEEWDTRDADEQGSQGWRYRGGVLLATGSAEFVWTEVQA